MHGLQGLDIFAEQVSQCHHWLGSAPLIHSLTLASHFNKINQEWTSLGSILMEYADWPDSSLNMHVKAVQQNYCHNPSPSPKSKVQSQRTWSDSILLCHPPTPTYHANFSQQPDIQFSSNFHSRLDCDIVESNSSQRFKSVKAAGMQSFTLTSLSLHQIWMVWLNLNYLNKSIHGPAVKIIKI